MLQALSLLLFLIAAVGLFAVGLQLFVAWVYHRERAPRTSARPGISILKPLCGVDNALEENLEVFANLDWPEYEVVLGVKDSSDPAYAVALKATMKWPRRMRLVLQRGEPGFNPKVNQLITLEAAARYDILVVSDSNVRVRKDYLQEIAAHFEDPEVACVTHPVVGIGEKTLGSRMDNLYLTTSIATGMMAAKAVAGQDVVVGKSMALRKSELAKLGGFLGAKDYLAEDYVLGRAIQDRLQKRVAVARSVIFNYSIDKSVKDFWRRYVRWSVLQKTAVEPTTYFGNSLLNPIPYAVLGWLLYPTVAGALAILAGTAIKTAFDLMAARSLRGEVSFKDALAVPVKDALIFGACIKAVFLRTVEWRGNKLRVLRGSKLVPLRGGASDAANEDVQDEATADAA